MPRDAREDVRLPAELLRRLSRDGAPSVLPRALVESDRGISRGLASMAWIRDAPESEGRPEMDGLPESEGRPEMDGRPVSDGRIATGTRAAAVRDVDDDEVEEDMLCVLAQCLRMPRA